VNTLLLDKGYRVCRGGRDFFIEDWTYAGKIGVKMVCNFSCIISFITIDGEFGRFRFEFSFFVNNLFYN
jgi:hypothetical protein